MARAASDHHQQQQQQQQQQPPPRPTAGVRRPTTTGERATPADPDLDLADGIDGAAPTAGSAERDALAATIRAQDAANAPDARNIVRNGLKYTLVIRQQPVHARLCGTAGSLDRRPVDPPPVVQVRIESVDAGAVQDAHFASDWYTHNPRLFVYAAAVPMPREKVQKARAGQVDEAAAAEPAPGGKAAPTLTYGSVVSALFRMPDVDGTSAVFAVFPDISIKNEGKLRFRFVLCEMVGAKVRRLASILSRPVTVWTPKKFPGLTPSTAWTKYVVHHGVKLRIRCMPTARTAPAAEPHTATADSTTPPSGATTPAPPGRRRGKRAHDATTHDTVDDHPATPAPPPPRPRPRALTLTTAARTIDADAILPLSPTEYHQAHAPNPPIAVPSQPHHVDPGAGLAAGYPGAYGYEVPSQPATPLLADASGGWGIDTMPPHSTAGWDHCGTGRAAESTSSGWAHWDPPAAQDTARYTPTTGWAHARGPPYTTWGDTTLSAPPIPTPIPPPTPTHAVYSTSVPATPMAAAFHVPATPTATAFRVPSTGTSTGYHQHHHNHHHHYLPPQPPTATTTTATDAYLPPTPTGVPMHFLTGPTADGSGSVASAAAPTPPDHASPYYHQHYQTAAPTAAAAAAAAWAHADMYYTRAPPGPPQQQQAGHHYLADPTMVGVGMGGYPRHATRLPVPVGTATAGVVGGGSAWHGGDGYGWLVGP
ncbi:hypothetical protein GGF31_005023 [Allomyces arbusculus]|nr:hypothetical protein GGF31_005023 [Allomyces arbusculus]